MRYFPLFPARGASATGSFLPALLFAVLALGGGCGGDEAAAPAALPPAKVAPAMQQAFDTAPPPLRAEVEAVLRWMQESQPAQAVAQLSQLTEQPGLTPDQRRVAGQTLQTALEQLRAAATSGDAGAREALEAYRASK